MSNIQSLLAIGSLFLLALVSLSFNGALLQSNTVEIENKVYLTAFSLADDLIEEIKQKAFDENTLTFPTVNRTTLTPTNSLGKEGEVYPYFDDIDDYHNYSRDADAPHSEKYHISSKVYYVFETDADTKSTDQTFHKRVDVTVSSPYLNNDVVLTFIFTHK
jgi:hydroxymethylpyrimidine pyrophosphatase-like HAD family hydrolase